MKKLLAIILACITAVSLCACKLSKKPESSSVPGHSNSSDTSSTVLSSNITGSSSTVSDNVSSNASSNTSGSKKPDASSTVSVSKDDSNVSPNRKPGNLKALYIGDSISYGFSDISGGYAWCGRIQCNYNIDGENRSHSGWTLSPSKGAPIYDQLKEASTDDYDYIIVQGGVNDVSRGTAFGSVSPNGTENFDLMTIAGALEHTLVAAKELNPDAVVGFVINYNIWALGTNPELYVKWNQYVKLAILVCEKWNIPYIDLDNTSGFSSYFNLKKHTTDLVHPNSDGYDIISKYIGNWMMSMKSETDKNHKEKIRIACVGDSITAVGYWQNRLQGHLSAKWYEVEGFGESGSTALSNGTDGYGTPKAYRDSDPYRKSIKYRPNAVVIMLGTNDSKEENIGKITKDNGKQFKADVKALIKSYEDIGARVFLALPPKALGRLQNFGWIDGAVIKNTIVPLLKSVAKETGVTLIDTQKATENATEVHFSDGVHPWSPEGKEIIAAAVAEVISKAYGH